MRRHLRFVRYLPLQCRVLSPEQPHPLLLSGRTRRVNAGGLEILLCEILPVGALVEVQICEGDPLRGSVISVGEGTPTLLGTRFPHGFAFEKSVDPALVRRWVSQAKKRIHARASIQFEVEYTQTKAIKKGTCLNLSQGGMFIAAEHPTPPGTEIMLHFRLPDVSKPFSLLSQVVWTWGNETTPNSINGMGVQFFELEPSDAAFIRTFVDRLDVSPASDSPWLIPPSR